MKAHQLLYFVYVGIVLGFLCGSIISSADESDFWIGYYNPDSLPSGLAYSSYCYMVSEWVYNVTSNMTITEIHVMTAKSYTSAQVNQMVLYINGISVGSPVYEASSSIFPWSGYHGLAWYGKSVNISSSNTLFELNIPFYLAGSGHIMVSTNDMDADGDALSSKNGVANGVYGGTQSGFDVVYACRMNYTTPGDAIDEYKTVFGDFFFEFYQYNNSCAFRVGDNPIFIYSLNDTMFSDVDGFIWRVYNSDGSLIREGIINIVGSSDDGYIIDYGYEFENIDFYQVLLYNITFNNTRDSVVWTSQVVSVCEDVIGSGDSGGDTYEYFSPSLTDEQAILIGVLISLAVGIGLMIITKSALVVPIGSGICLFMLSSESMGIYQLLPSDVGIGLIAVLVLIGVLMYFFS